MEGKATKMPKVAKVRKTIISLTSFVHKFA